MTTPQDSELSIETMSRSVSTLLARITQAGADDRVAPASIRDGLDELDEVLDYWICAAKETNDAFKSRSEDRFLTAALTSQIGFSRAFSGYLQSKLPTCDQERHFAKVRRLVETYGGDLLESLQSLCAGRQQLVESLVADAQDIVTGAQLDTAFGSDPQAWSRETGSDAPAQAQDKFQRFEDTLNELITAQARLRDFIAKNFPMSPATAQYIVNAKNVGVVGSGATVTQQDFHPDSGNASPVSE